LSDAKKHYARVHSAVSDVRRKLTRRLVYETLVFVVAVSTATLSAGVLLFAFADPLPVFRTGVIGVWLGLVGATFWWRLLRPLSAWRDVRRVGRLIEDRFPAFRSDVTASLQFGLEIDDLRGGNQVSLALVERLLADTARSVDQRRHELAGAVPKAQTRWGWAVAGMTVACLAICALAFPTATSRGLQGLMFGAGDAILDNGPKRQALVGDITLTFQYPDYTGLGRRTIEGTTGEIQVLAGTRVELSATGLVPVQRAEIVLISTDTPAETDVSTPEAGPQRIVLQRRPGGRLVAAFTALHSGSYSIEAVLANGREAYDGITRPITIHPDEDPKIELTRPEGEVDVAPQDTVTFVYEASDDYGLVEVAIVSAFSFGKSKEKTRTIVRGLDTAAAERLPGDARPTGEGAPAEKRAWAGEYVLDLGPLELQPKDRVVVNLEVVDNDTITGPKVTTSRTVVLRVASPEDKHLEIIQTQEEIFEALLDVLGDYLEKPVGERWSVGGQAKEGIPVEWTAADFAPRYTAAVPPHGKAGTIIKTMEALLESMQQDPLMIQRDFELFKRTHGDLAALHRAEKQQLDAMETAAKREDLRQGQMVRLFDHRKKSVRGTERAIVAIEDLIAAMRMENVLESAKDLKEAQQRLKELLQKYKETNDPAVKAEIMKQLQRLQQRMREMLAKMQKQLKDLPKEHMNMEAFQKEGMMAKTQDLKSAMDKIMEALEKGDLDAAMAELDKMNADMDSMIAEMEGEFDEMQPSGLSKMDKRVSELMDRLSDLENQEKAIQKETEEIQKEMERENEERVNKALEEFKQREMEKVRKLKEQLENTERKGLSRQDQEQLDRAARRAGKLERALESGDVSQALGEARELESDLEALQRNMGFQKRYMRPKDPRKAGYDKATDTLKKAQPKAKEITDDLEKLMENARPRPSSQQSGKLQKLEGQQGEVRRRTDELKKEVAGDSEFPMLGEELTPGLEEAGQYMKGAGQRLGEGQPRRAGENEKLALDKLGGLKKQLRRSLQKQHMGGGEGGNQEGGRKVKREDVEIPDADRKAPREFREDIMEAMKEQQLGGYEDELQQYYESLVK
jgi:hypothetical protein